MTPNLTQDVVLVDPVCAKRTGHNLPTLVKYANFFERYGITVRARHVASTFIETPENCIADLSFNYAPFITPDKTSRRHIAQIRLANGIGKGFAQELTKFFLIYPILHSVAAKAAQKNLTRLFNLYPNATLFFPGADFYTIWALRELALNGKLTHLKICLRLMGVMETVGYMPVPDKVLPRLISDIARIAPRSVVFSAETEKYARLIEHWTQFKIKVTGIPSFPKLDINLASEKRTICHRDITPSQPLILGFLGGARADKGFHSIPQIAHDLYARFGLTVICLVQSMRPSELYYSKAVCFDIARWPNVIMLPDTLTDEQLITQIRNCDALVLPYSIGTYQNRGSAMLFDALSLGKIVFGQSGTGFAETISSYSLGYTFSDSKQLVDAVGKHIDTITNTDNKVDFEAMQRNYLSTLNQNLLDLVSNNEEILYIH